MNLKSTISSWLRKAGLMFLADKILFLWQYLVHYRANKKFKSDYPAVCLPPPYMMFESFNMSYEKYYLGGQYTAKWILQLLEQYVPPSPLHVLDWGCGPARITRHIKKKLGLNAVVFGTDYNTDTIKWCHENIDDIKFSVNNTSPPLTYEESTFDIIIGISIFTHLSEKNHTAWTNELSRVLKPGGIAFITTHGDIFRAILTDSEKAQYDRQAPVIRDQVQEGHRVFTAFQPPSWMNSIFSEVFEIIDYHPGANASWGKEQDYWILKKK